MKKMLVIPMIILMLVMLATSTFAATTTLADKIYAKGSAYGVTKYHKEEMQRYFTNNPVTADEEAYILKRADECIAIMDKAGVKDVTKLSEKDLNTVKAKVIDAAAYIGLTVSFDGYKVIINGKSGDKVIELTFKANNKGTTSTTSKKFVYTGSNTTFGIGSIAMATVALVAVVKLRKNA